MKLYLIPGGPRIDVEAKARQRSRARWWRAILAGLVVFWVVVGFMVDRAVASVAAPSCSLTVPRVVEQADGSGVQTGHVAGSCNFAWHSKNLIEYRDRWHVLGTNAHAGGAAGVYVVQPVDREDYGELYGEWREVVQVRDATGRVVVTVMGPVSRIV